ncbi:xanthine dehydrogenase 1 isoform X2 [Spinacia oleracea]|uniref:Xanthine dehydrogenase 1 isoform X2 n=1 Tax=Spinacia oleracea TaxID=3562 RepID=A0A9R0IFY4_SPIOL|nr:xanthine dehydrogenase 1-like isoform X2 [Spinacia oleracea]
MESLKSEEEIGVIEAKESIEAIIYINGVRKVIPDGLAHLTLLPLISSSVEIDGTYGDSEGPKENNSKQRSLVFR